jgi:hypothetical protein
MLARFELFESIMFARQAIISNPLAQDQERRWAFNASLSNNFPLPVSHFRSNN